MLSLLIYAFNLAKDVGYFGLVASYKTGQLIIRCLNITFDILTQINKAIGTLFRVLLEDFYIFLCDVGQRVLNIVTVIYNVFQNIANFITAIIEGIKFVFSSITFIITVINNGIFGIISKTISGIGHAFVLIKQLIVLLGAGIWFTVTLIPLFIIYISTMCTYYLGCLLDEIINLTVNIFTSCKTLINNLYEFVTDVPIESIAGLITGACIMYVIIKFHILLYHKIISVLELIRRNIHHIRTRLSRRLWMSWQSRRQQEDLTSSEPEETSSSDEGMEEDNRNCGKDESRLCIICQERMKCMLMLPCRHVCLCSVCNARWKNYNRNCPMCRCFVQSNMKVFV